MSGPIAPLSLLSSWAPTGLAFTGFCFPNSSANRRPLADSPSQRQLSGSCGHIWKMFGRAPGPLSPSSGPQSSSR